MAKRESNLLTDVQIRKWVRAGAPVAKSDGGGLTFTLSAAGAATWVLRFRHGGRRQELTLGRYPDISLSAARAAAAKRRVAVSEGINPADEVRKAKARKDWTVRQLAGDYREKVLSTLAISTQRSYGRNLKRVENGMGSMSVQSIGPADIVAEIERHDLGWVETFTLWCVLRGLFKHAAGKKIIVSNPCAGILLDAIIGKRPEVKQRLMLTDDELHVLLNAKMRDVNLYAIRIALATGVRISELYTARRRDLYLDEARWYIPKSKTGPEMDIPLAPIVIDWFERLLDLAGTSEYILPARLNNRLDRHDGDTHVSKDAIREAIDYWIEHHDPAIRRFTPHDLRSTMKSHMRRLKVSRDISEMCLNHKVPGVEGIYDQYTYWDERREALELWAAYLITRMRGETWNVIPINRSA
ncbi:tyrosine-type recombinase/integrase [Burkholderia cenocepacia]|uniref:tyrosine-type recombinase/integrase n=1 Tax=Burkholderia cenocepacia TaxID=95486 RepID=UPI002B250A10|nr:integrase arm-type DNA-binding domain-containing protein [Burkholderia cenocepacia]MEB2544363.1 tyrosine-type recombinase/integrase [Burkholderia cenocepacia]